MKHRLVSRSYHAGGLTPLGAYAALRQRPGSSFLLESVLAGTQLGRYSFVAGGIEDRLLLAGGQLRHEGPAVWKLADLEPAEALDAFIAQREQVLEPDAPPFVAGLVGYLGFDALAPRDPLGAPSPEGADLPDAAFLVVDTLLVFDHARSRLSAHALIPEDEDPQRALRSMDTEIQALSQSTLPPLPHVDGAVPEEDARVEPDTQTYCQQVRELQRAIVDGEMFQCVLSRQWTVDQPPSPLAIYRELRDLNPSPYMVLMEDQALSLVGASPEVLVRATPEELLLRPIAGTRPRGTDSRQDAALGEELLADPKELAEHRMLVDLGRNDLARVAVPGSVRVEDPLHLEHFSHVQHIVTDIRAQRGPQTTPMQILRACGPAGTVSGAPKRRAVEWIRRMESSPRGPYAGAMGYIGVDGALDTCITIRTIVLSQGGAVVQAGAGIVHDSKPELEAQECANKARAALEAIARARRREPGA